MALSEQDLSDIKSLLGREASTVELSIFDTMWSEHCSYKSSKPVLKTLPTEGSEVALGIGEDSGIIRFSKENGKQYCIAVSHESHNHPSQILPVEGAATGVGGVVRDVYCMGADVVGVLNSLHFGINRDGSAPIVDEIAEEVVVGVSDYANPLGVPVLGGETLYDESYNDNCLVNVAALGLLEEDDIIHSFVPEEAKREPYDIILVGKSTDATGFGGASFSSATLDQDDDATNLGAVQVHDPFLKRVIVEAIKALFKIVRDDSISIGFKDLGAGGISCAASEIAVGGGYGVVLDLDKVNVAMAGLPAEVIACSETQERFCLAVPRSFTPRVLSLFNEDFALPSLYHKAGAVVIGDVCEELVFKVYHQGVVVCDLPVKAITTEVRAERFAEERSIVRRVDDFESPTVDFAAVGLSLLKNPNNTSKRYVYRFFDNAVRGDAVIYPGEADAVVCSPIEGSHTGLAVSMDSNLYGGVDPYVSGAYAVAESVRNVISVGGRPLAATDCLNYGNPEKPSVFYDFEEGVRGIGEACRALGFIDGETLPIISGNVSFYNESKTGNAVVPSPVIVVLGRVDDYRDSITMQVQEAGLKLYLVGERFPEFGGTQIAGVMGELPKVAPQVRLEDEALQNRAVYELIQSGKIANCHDISCGGLWQCLSEMVLGERGRGAVGISVEFPEDLDPFVSLYSENGGYVLAVKDADVIDVETVLNERGVWYRSLGQTTSDAGLVVSQSQELVSLDLDTLADPWGSRNLA